MALTTTQTLTIQSRSENYLYRRDGLLCALLMIMCLVCAQPFVEMGFSDDWSYIKTAQVFAQTGQFVYNGWATAALGWQVLWGALFSKLFGFSFVHVRLSTLPVAAASVYLFHQILVRFGISRGNAIFGTLTLALSPVFMAMSASYMTDLPGLFCILLCLYLCQGALSATKDRVALAWLCFAAATNIVGGTVRQTAWLGVLFIVPSTVWLLRGRRSVLWGGSFLWLAGIASVVACLHWVNQQPYFVPQDFVTGVFTRKALKHTIIREILQGVKTFLCLLLLVFPVLAAWFPLARSLPRRSFLWLFVSSTALLTGFLVYCPGRDDLSSWLAPWLTHVMSSMASNGGDIPGPSPGPFHTWQRLIVTAPVLGSALIFFLHLFSGSRRRRHTRRDSPYPWSQMAWLLVPWTLAYIGSLMDIGFHGWEMFDRYLLSLQAVGIIFLLRYYQDFVAPIGRQEDDRTYLIGRLPAVSHFALLASTYFAIAGTHDWFAISRARLDAAEEVRRSGVPSTAIQAGFEYDAWTQLEASGHINEPRIRIPRDAFQRVPLPPNPTPECAASWFPSTFTPVVVPQYFIVHAPLACVAPSSFPPVTFRTWMPPFTRQVSIYQRRD